MNFSSPLPRATQPRFSEGSSLRSVRDSSSNSRLWTKNGNNTAQDSRNGQILQQHTRAIQQLRRTRAGGYITPPQTQLSHPFKIYQPTNVGSFTQGVTFLGGDGTPTLCNIDATKPTNFSSVPPTVNPTTDAWRFWTVRCGQVEVRFNYTLMQVKNYFGSAPFYDLIEADGNWTAKYNVQVYTDGNAPCYNQINFDDPTTIIRVGFDAPMPLIISQIADGTHPVIFGIWINISPDTSSASLPTALICGNAIVATSTNQNPFPLYGPNVVPVGIIRYYSAGNFGDGTSLNYVEQRLFDHVQGRFPSGSGNSKIIGGPITSNVFNFRGQYNYNVPASTLPSDLTSQIFYPGDVVMVYNSSGLNGLYMNQNKIPYAWGGGGGFLSNWNRITTA
ncbi:MAG: hypothetical protein KGL39_10220 [Patescibacteria group bacterium]|nr:hypothetical protein [Patescibacteria group bacterium]